MTDYKDAAEFEARVQRKIADILYRKAISAVMNGEMQFEDFYYFYILRDARIAVEEEMGE